MVTPKVGPPISIPGHVVAKIALILVVLSVLFGGIMGRFAFFVAAFVVWTWVVLAGGDYSLGNSFWLNLLKINRKERLMRVLIKAVASIILLLSLIWFSFSLIYPILSEHEWRAFSWPSLHERQVDAFSALSDERVIFYAEEDCLKYIAEIRQKGPTRIYSCAADCDTTSYKYDCGIVR